LSPSRIGLPKSKPKSLAARVKKRTRSAWKHKWVRVAAGVAAVPATLFFAATIYYYFHFAHMIDDRLHGERDRVLPRVLARPLEIHAGESLTDRQLIDRLNDLGYAERPTAEKPGEFQMEVTGIALLPRTPEFAGKTVHVLFQKPLPPAPKGVRRAPPKPSDHIEQLLVGTEARERLELDAPVLSALTGGEREKRRQMALSAIPPRIVQAVLSIEDRRFYEHPGVDPIGMAGALLSYATGRRSQLAGASTITQQLVRNVFLPNYEGMTLQEARARDLRRKALEIGVSLVLTSRATKDDILEMYLNDVPLGQRGSFAIYGVPEAARLFFGKDIRNVSLAEAATIAGVIQSPSRLSPFSNPARCRDRRNVVLHAMADAGYITEDAATMASKEPLTVVQRALEAEAPYFVDYVGQSLGEAYPGLTTTTDEAVDVYTTLDLHLQRLAQDAVRNGLAGVDKQLAHRKRKGLAEAALIAVDPQTGDILAMVGGRSYNQSQYNRAVVSRRQPGSVFKPFVYLTAFEEALNKGRTDVTPASIVDDSPTTWEFDNQVWTPENYEDEYDGPTTYRHALANSRNIAAIKVAEQAGYDKVAALWKKLGVGNPPKAYPSIALGVFEATPLEIATAYTIFPNQGMLRQLQNVLKVTRGGTDITKPREHTTRAIARPETTYLVTSMMRSVLEEGTAAAARGMGFTLDAAGKTGTTNDLRDAWFVGFTPELLTAVWVGYDDFSQPLGLTGAQAALPIWVEFMKRALTGEEHASFHVPDGINFVDIDKDNGKLATPMCPNVFREGFIEGTEPVVACEVHRYVEGGR
jgi:penicillin-binding protein 1B